MVTTLGQMCTCLKAVVAQVRRRKETKHYHWKTCNSFKEGIFVVLDDGKQGSGDLEIRVLDTDRTSVLTNMGDCPFKSQPIPN